MFGSGVGIGMETIHLQSKQIQRDLKQARTGSAVVGRGMSSRGVLVSPSASTATPPTAASTLVFVSPGPAFRL